MIRNFADMDSRALFEGRRVRRWQAIETAALRKLAMLNRAATLDDLKIPPANRLEALRGGRTGQYSIRINDQYRICFVRKQGGVFDVAIVDYH